jgi:allantoicase
VIAPFGPINMFDGMESARSRIPGHFEEVVIKLARTGKIHRMEMDFTWFVNNNPLEVSVDGLSNGKWVTVIPKTFVKAFRGNKKVFEIESNEVFEQLKLRTYPCGGINRFKAFSK